jgi:hypothetical protein
MEKKYTTEKASTLLFCNLLIGQYEMGIRKDMIGKKYNPNGVLYAFSRCFPSVMLRK